MLANYNSFTTYEAFSPIPNAYYTPPSYGPSFAVPSLLPAQEVKLPETDEKKSGDLRQDMWGQHGSTYFNGNASVGIVSFENV